MTSSAPAIAVIGSNGYIGQMVMPCLFEALEQNRIKELRILSRKFDENALKGLIAKGATTQNASYHNIASLTQALAGIDVVISISLFFQPVSTRANGRHDGIPGRRFRQE